MKLHCKISLCITAFVLLLLMLAIAGGAPLPVPTKLTKAIHQVETSGRLGPILGDNGKALGPFQIHKSYWQDSGVKGSYSRCSDYNYALQVVTGYLNRYGKQFIRSNNLEALARIHNGGPTGHQKAATKHYWAKVKKELDK